MPRPRKTNPKPRVRKPKATPAPVAPPPEPDPLADMPRGRRGLTFVIPPDAKITPGRLPIEGDA